jgi:hypothetical protein
MDNCRFAEKQNWSEGNYAKESLIGRIQEKIFQIRMQEIIAKYSCAEKFPAKIILPDTRARPMGIAIKDLFYCIADANGFPRPEIVFVATPKISQNNTPGKPKELFDQYGIVTTSHLAELNNTTLLDPSFNKRDPYTDKFLSNADRLYMHDELTKMRSALFERIQNLKIEDDSNILVIDDVCWNFTTFTEIGIAIRSLGVKAKLYLETIFYNGTGQTLNFNTQKCEALFGDLLKNDLCASVSFCYGTFKQYEGELKNIGVNENGKIIYAPDEIQRAIGVIKKPYELYSQKIENLSVEDKRNIRALRQRLNYTAGKALLDPMSKEEIEDFRYMLQS